MGRKDLRMPFDVIMIYTKQSSPLTVDNSETAVIGLSLSLKLEYYVVIMIDKNWEIPKISNTFEHSAAIILNSLPQSIRACTTYHAYVKNTRTVFMERAKQRLLN